MPSNAAGSVVKMTKNKVGQGVSYIPYGWCIRISAVVELGKGWFATNRATPFSFASKNYNSFVKNFYSIEYE